MPGPAPTPNVIRMLRGNPSKRRMRREIDPPREPEPPQPPAYLAGDARDEWVRIAPMLHALGVLRATDHAVLAAYCTAFGRWRQAERALDAMAGALVLKGRNGMKTNPLTRISAQAARDMVKYAAELGIGPAARARIAAGPHGEPPGGPPSKFDGLLGG